MGRVRRHVDPRGAGEALVDVAHASRMRTEFIRGQMPVFVVSRAGPKRNTFLEGCPARLDVRMPTHPLAQLPPRYDTTVRRALREALRWLWPVPKVLDF